MDALNKAIQTVMEQNEKKSWELERQDYFDVGVKRGSGIRKRYFHERITQQAQNYPQGITEDEALKMGDIVYKTVIIRQRIK